MVPLRYVSACHAEWLRALNLENLERNNYQRLLKGRENEQKLRLLIVGNLRSCEQDKQMLHVNAFLSEFRIGRTLQIHAGVMSPHDSPEVGRMIRPETFLILFEDVCLIDGIRDWKPLMLQRIERCGHQKSWLSRSGCC